MPTLAAYINLVNSGHPLLEYRGSHAIARLCYAAPYGVENVRQHIRDAKAVTAILGGIDALFALLKRVNKRCVGEGRAGKGVEGEGGGIGGV